LSNAAAGVEAVRAPDDVQIGMFVFDAGVDDRDIGIDSLVVDAITDRRPRCGVAWPAAGHRQTR
jgi:hypothetical protein